MAEGDKVTQADMELDTDTADALPLNLKLVRDTAERETIDRALAHAENNLAQAARLLGISRPTLYGLLEKHQVRVPER